MKKILFLLFTVASGFLTAQAQDESRLLISAGQLQNISLGDNMRVVLVSAETFDSEVKGDMKVFEKLSTTISGGSMHIKSIGHSGKETIYVVVNQLKRLTLGQNTQVSTEGILRSEEITVFVEDGSVARIKTTGEVNAYSLDTMDVSVKKFQLQPKPFAKGF
ncbi:MAG: DUF2807 domain-containing protein [Chitinophagaceae bacterium]